jgi:hypothetical protein
MPKIDLQLTFETPALRQKTVNAFAHAYGYKEAIPNPDNPAETIPNPETKLQFMVKRIRQHMREVTRAHAINDAAEAARAAAAKTFDDAKEFDE